MLFDHCTWDEDYKQITQQIRRKLLKLAHVQEPEYTAVLMQGSGTFGVESVLTSVVGKDDRLLIAANGAYGLRMESIAQHAGLSYLLYAKKDCEQPDASEIAEILAEKSRYHSRFHGAQRDDQRDIKRYTFGGRSGEKSRLHIYRRCHVQFRRCRYSDERMGHRLHDQQCQQMHPGSPGIFFRHRQTPSAGGERRKGRAVCLSICMISGRLWKKMENGVSPVLHT